MPKSLLILIVAAVAGLSVLTWFQFFRDPSAAPPVIGGVVDGEDVPELPVKEKDEPLEPAEIPRDVPLEVRASELMRALVRAMLGTGEPVSPEDLAWLRDTEEGVAELMKLLENSDDDNLKAVVLLTLGQSRIDGTFDALKDASGGQYGDALRTAGVAGMINGQEESIPVLRRIYSETRDEGVAAASLQVLAHLDYDRALAAFSDLLASTPDATRRDTLYQILGGHRFPLETEEPEVMVRFRAELDGLYPAEPDPDPEQVIVIDNLVDQLIREEDPRLRMASTVVLARMPGRKAEEAFVKRYRAADDDHKLGLLGLIHPDNSRGKIKAFLRLAPEMEDQRQREMLSMQVATWRDPRIVGEVRIWRDLEKDETIRQRLDLAIREMEGR